MKNKVFLSLGILLIPLVSIAQVGIGTADPHPSAIQEIKSTTGGFLLPRMTVKQMNAIEDPARGLMIFCRNCGQGDVMIFNTNWVSISDHTILYGNDGKVYKELISRSSGRTWLDRNLGAEQMATSYDDYKAYGSLYQWGRLRDGHEKIGWTSSDWGNESGFTIVQSDTIVPGHDDFIGSPPAPNDPHNDWLETSNDNLWQGVNGINNPCPSGFRIPTKEEFEAETNIINDLRLAYSGYRESSYGSLNYPSFQARYWSSSIVNNKVIYLEVKTTDNNIQIKEESYRNRGLSVRCIKDES